MRIPRCYFSTIDESGQNPLLLLEDLAPAQVAECIFVRQPEAAGTIVVRTGHEIKEQVFLVI